MAFRLTIAAACAAAGLLTAMPASAACSIQALPIRITMEGLRPLVTLKVNGQDGRFLIDSGSVTNGISGKFAAAQKLQPMEVTGEGSHVRDTASTTIVGAAGTLTLNGLVIAQQVQFVGTTFKNVVFMASDRLGGPGLKEDGLLGQPMLRQFDVEYDLKGGVLRLVKPQDCQGKDMVYWAKDGTPYSKMPLETPDRDNPHTVGVVFVNGVKMRAVFDTGASLSFITEHAAARAGVKTTDPGVTPAGVGRGLDNDLKVWVGTFKTVKIGEEEIQNAPLEIGQSDADGFDILVGADFFMAHHVYVANSQEKIYFTYSGGPVFQVYRPDPTAPAGK